MRILYDTQQKSFSWFHHAKSLILVDAWFDFYRELNIDGANQSLRIIKNLIDAGSCQSYAAIDICMLLEFTNLIIRTKLSDAYGLVVKVLSAVRLWFFFTINIDTPQQSSKPNESNFSSFAILYHTNVLQFLVWKENVILSLLGMSWIV
jgi:hypothetical protein